MAVDTKLRSDGAKRRFREGQRSREQMASVADIGDIPNCQNPKRRKKCARNLRLFLTTYFPASTGLKPFSDDHQRVITRMQDCILRGGRHLSAVYRGFAKTTMSENAAIWATVYGHRKFCPLIGADEAAAKANVDSIKMELETNGLLYEDFPEVCYPIWQLEGKPQRCGSQTYNGSLTHIEWTADKIVLPSIPGSKASGAIIITRGITGRVRGMVHKRADGVQQRPDFVIIDDPQTDESAHSPSQVDKRLDIIRKAILKSTGHTSTLACVMNATVIARDDVIDRLLDHAKNPAWQSERIPMVKKWADKHESLWLGDYKALRNSYNPDLPGDQARAHKDATAFYSENREAMDAGCDVSWVHCYDADTELSSIQHAYNALIDDGEEVFASEYQNEPIQDVAEAGLLGAQEIAGKTNGIQCGVIPSDCTHLTQFVDVQGKVLYWVVCGWTDDMTGYVVDYGTWPEQNKPYFTLAEVKKTLSRQAPGSGFKAALYHALQQMAEETVGREWPRDGGGTMRIERCLIDANWGESTNVVYQFCRQSVYAPVLLPSHGRYVGASSMPLPNRARKQPPGDIWGHNWVIPALKGRRAVRHVVFDTNYWKSTLFDMLGIQMGDTGCLSLFGADPKPHRMLADHAKAEYPVRTEGRGRTVDEWKQLPSEPDNHLFDCLVGCAVGASILGCKMVGDHRVRKRRKVKLSELVAGKVDSKSSAEGKKKRVKLSEVVSGRMAG